MNDFDNENELGLAENRGDDLSGWSDWDSDFGDVPELNSSSELHGIVAGMLTVIQAPTQEEWQLILSTLDVRLEDDALMRLTEEGEDVSAILNEEDLDFYLMLPDDDHILEERVIAFSDWCNGVLLGFGLVGGTEKGAVRPDEAELLKDLSMFAGMSFDPEMPEEEQLSEVDFAEMVEFARLIPFSLSVGRKKIPVSDTPLFQQAMAELQETVKQLSQIAKMGQSSATATTPTAMAVPYTPPADMPDPELIAKMFGAQQLDESFKNELLSDEFDTDDFDTDDDEDEFVAELAKNESLDSESLEVQPSGTVGSSKG